MAAFASFNFRKILCRRSSLGLRSFHETSSLLAVQAGKYKPTRDASRPLTYEQANPPPQIAHRKSWNSWNTTTIEGGLRTGKTAIDDIFIRKFLLGTFCSKVVSEIIIKRQHNIIRIAAILLIRQSRSQYAFLIGYTEELLGYWLQAPVKLELQFVEKPTDVVFKYI